MCSCWLDQIYDELKSSKIVILMLSKRSVKSPWINFEAGAAWILDRRLIPVCYGGLSRQSLPKPYDNFQGLDVRTEAHRLLNTIGKCTAQKPESPGAFYIALMNALDISQM